MNIGIVCHSAYGGSGTVAVALGRELARRGHSVHIIAHARPVQLVDDSPGIRFHQVEPLDHPFLESQDSALALATALVDIVCAQQINLLNIHYAIPYAISALLAREMLPALLSLPIITTLHGTDVTTIGKNPALRSLLRFVITRSDGVTAVSHSLAVATSEMFGLPVSVIPNFVDATEFKPQHSSELRRRLSGRGERRLLIHVSNFRPVKRITDCVRIFATVVRTIPSLLIMVGDGPDAGAAEKLAEELGVADDVLFVGQQRHVVDYLAAADLLLLPSETESFGLVALEAMSCEVPVVASRTGGLPEVVTDGVSGWLLPVGEIDVMAAAAIGLLKNAPLAAEMGRRGRKIAVEHFSADLVVPQYLNCFQQAIERCEAFERVSGQGKSRLVKDGRSCMG